MKLIFGVFAAFSIFSPSFYLFTDLLQPANMSADSAFIVSGSDLINTKPCEVNKCQISMCRKSMLSKQCNDNAVERCPCVKLRLVVWPIKYSCVTIYPLLQIDVSKQPSSFHDPSGPNDEMDDVTPGSGMDALEWSNGIGVLPGSNIKVQ